MKAHKSANFFYKMITFISILSIVPVIIVGIFSFIRSSDLIEEHVANEKQQSVYQIQTNIEQILKTVDHSLTHFATSSHIKQALREPLTTEQFQLYNQLKEELSHQQTFDTRISDVVLVSYPHRWLINNYGLQRLSEEQATGIQSTYASIAIESTWMFEKSKQPLYKQLPGGYCEYDVTLVKNIPLTSSNKTGIAFANIPTCSFQNILSQSSDSERIIILDSNSIVIGHTDKKEIGKRYNDTNILKLLEESTSDIGQFNSKLNETDYKITYRKSIYNNWTYLSLVKLSDLSKQSSSIGWFTFFTCFILASISLIIVLVGSKRIYRPIKRLQDVVLPSFTMKEDKKPRNEFDIIESKVQYMLKQNDHLEETLQSQVSQLKQFFILRLLDGKVDKGELPGKLKSFGYNQDFKQISILALQIDTLENTGFASKEEDVLLFVINTMIEELIPSQYRMTPIVKNNAQITILTSRHDTKEQHIYYLNNIAETIKRIVKEDLNIPVSIGISEPFNDISKSKHAYKESLEALKYTLKFGTESVIFFENLERGQAFHTYFPKQIENELFDAIKISDKDKVDDLLDQLLTAIFEKDLNHLQYQIAIVRFLNDLIELMQTLGIDVLELEDNRSMFEKIHELKSFAEVRGWLVDMIINPLINKIEKRSESQYKNISDNIIHIIQEEFDTDITLDIIAARLHYNPNYLSSVFRKEMNISFSEYLSLYRLNSAKKWLLETDMSVKEISERLNYNNPQNFIRSFRKIEGTTPGKYREIKKTF
ncbi:helix-turn-helix domain-containing protein [Lederbergia lenta]|uniref:Transcriptional regulator n=1 Tax=Lederbergia lenta TaxID=1467 RepID=A0A2X4ZK42_LEDLE|nr:helix-turn-helix domain-containing protein [Lederbergia lenta]MCM3110418.1 AraC family transcriptional regulator [Lederbergia lenta]MEC2324015.1 AraC family transcriptional regulator [Lederbergia lenta]SQI60824.1 transcriptional regulator [Lederbergia lenta]